MEIITLHRWSYSPVTIADLKRNKRLEDESNQDQIRRLSKKYGLAEQDVRLLIVSDCDHVGRIKG